MIKVKTFQKKIINSKVLPYGLALMILRGAAADLEDAIKLNDMARVRICIERLQDAKHMFSLACNNFDKNSFVEQSYSQVEEESVIVADTIYQTAVSYVRSTLLLV